MKPLLLDGRNTTVAMAIVLFPSLPGNLPLLCLLLPLFHQLLSLFVSSLCSTLCSLPFEVIISVHLTHVLPHIFTNRFPIDNKWLKECKYKETVMILNQKMHQITGIHTTCPAACLCLYPLLGELQLFYSSTTNALFSQTAIMLTASTPVKGLVLSATVARSAPSLCSPTICNPVTQQPPYDRLTISTVCKVNSHHQSGKRQCNSI